MWKYYDYGGQHSDAVEITIPIIMQGRSLCRQNVMAQVTPLLSLDR